VKKTQKINIGITDFYIDEDAYAILSDYLNSLRKRFGNSQEGKEIMEDIELRIAELMQEKISAMKQVINLYDITKIIETMGQSDDFFYSNLYEDENEATNNSQNNNYELPKEKTNYKKMYRDSDNRVLGGVCGGIGAYFGIDPVFIRIAFAIAILAYGTGTFLYILLWIVLPEAKTPSQKLEMHGKPVDIANIEKSVRDEFGKVKNSFSKK